jgi:hypothetical protein
MSKENGRVTMTCKIPVIGTVSGYKTMEEIVGKKTRPTDDKPAVTYEDLNGDGPVASVEQTDATTTDRSGGESTKDSNDDGKTTISTSTRADGSTASGASGDKSSAQDNEKAAAKLFKLARDYIMSGHGDLGRRKLRELVRKYPDTRSAKRAKRLLSQ